MAKKKTVIDFREMKHRGEKVAWLTAYDFPTANLAEQAGIDMLLVGDSLGICYNPYYVYLCKFLAAINVKPF